MSTDLTPFGVPAITQHMIDTLKYIASLKNKDLIDTYYREQAKVVAGNMWAVSMGKPTQPNLSPPMLMFVDENLVAQLESERGIGNIPPQDDRWNQIWFYVQYVPIVPPTPPTPTVIIGAEELYYPGFFTTTSGDGPAVTIGSVVNQNGHSYKKTVIGHSPFAPNGNVTAWQQIS